MNFGPLVRERRKQIPSLRYGMTILEGMTGAEGERKNSTEANTEILTL